jgi:hypothetical protein
MGKWPMRMDAGSRVTAGVAISGAAHAHAVASAVQPPLPPARRWCRAWPLPTFETALERLRAVSTPTPGGRSETAALLRLAATF